MPKVGMEPIRRRQLIDATLASIHSDGFSETTVASISRRAGVSTGVVHHYFHGKEDLLEATLRKLLGDLGTAVRQRMERASSPRERVEAVIGGNLDAAFFTPQSVIVWLAFWARVPHSQSLQRLQRINSGRMHSNLRHALKQIMPAAQAEEITIGICALLDGLWVSYAVTEQGVNPESARRIALDYLNGQLAKTDAQGEDAHE